MKDFNKIAVLGLILLSIWSSQAFVLLEEAEEDCLCHYCEEGDIGNAEACEYYCSDCDRLEYGVGNDFTLLDTLGNGNAGSTLSRSNSYKKWDATPFNVKDWPGSLKSVTVMLSQQNSGQTSNLILALYSSPLDGSIPQTWVAHLGTKAVIGSTYTQTTFTPTLPVPLEKNTRYWVALGRLNGNNHGLKHTSTIPSDHPCFIEYTSIFLSSPDQATPFNSEGKNIAWDTSTEKTNTGLMMKIVAVTETPTTSSSTPPPTGPTYSDVTLYSNLGSGTNTQSMGSNYKKWDGNYFDTTSNCPEGTFKSLTLYLQGPSSSGTTSTVVAALWKSAKTSDKPTDFVGTIGTAVLPYTANSPYLLTTITATGEFDIEPDTRYWWVLSRTAGSRHGIQRASSGLVEDTASYVEDADDNKRYTSGDQNSVDPTGQSITFSTWTKGSNAYRFKVVGSMLDED